jgi:hypothetical protein
MNEPRCVSDAWPGKGSGRAQLDRAHPRWCMNNLTVVRLHFANHTIRTVTGMPSHAIQLGTLHAIFASVR